MGPSSRLNKQRHNRDADHLNRPAGSRRFRIRFNFSVCSRASDTIFVCAAFTNPEAPQFKQFRATIRFFLIHLHNVTSASQTIVPAGPRASPGQARARPGPGPGPTLGLPRASLAPCLGQAKAWPGPGPGLGQGLVRHCPGPGLARVRAMPGQGQARNWPGSGAGLPSPPKRLPKGQGDWRMAWRI